MQSVSQKLCTGLLELRTPSGSLYVTPTYSQRLYLLWIFRHFRSLSRQVLSQRQQQFIDQLSQNAIAWERSKVARASIIGAVENVGNITARPRSVSLPAADNLVQMPPARVPVLSAVGSEVATIPQKRNNVRPMPEPQLAARFTPLSARKAPKQKESPRPAVSSTTTAVKLTPRKWLEWATGAALGVALLGVVFYVTELRPSSSTAAVQPLVSSQARSQAAPVASPTTSSVAPVSEQTVTSAPPPTLPTVAAATVRPDPVHSAKPRMEPPSPPPVESSSIPRVHVTGAPAHNFIYPEAPNASLTGTVYLSALIGPDGFVKHVDVLSGKPALARPAVDAMRHWRYSPPQSDGQAAEAETRVTINFVGDDAVTIVFPMGEN